MTAKELIVYLSQLDPETVVYSTSDEFGDNYIIEMESIEPGKMHRRGYLLEQCRLDDPRNKKCKLCLSKDWPLVHTVRI